MTVITKAERKAIDSVTQDLGNGITMVSMEDAVEAVRKEHEKQRVLKEAGMTAADKKIFKKIADLKIANIALQNRAREVMRKRNQSLDQIGRECKQLAIEHGIGEFVGNDGKMVTGAKMVKAFKGVRPTREQAEHLANTYNNVIVSHSQRRAKETASPEDRKIIEEANSKAMEINALIKANPQLSRYA